MSTNQSNEQAKETTNGQDSDASSDASLKALYSETIGKHRSAKKSKTASTSKGKHRIVDDKPHKSTTHSRAVSSPFTVDSDTDDDVDMPKPSTSAAARRKRRQIQSSDSEEERPVASAGGGASSDEIEALEEVSPRRLSFGSDDELEALPDNQLFGKHTDDSRNVADKKTGEIIVNVNPKLRLKRDYLVTVAPALRAHLKPHQIGGLRFMFDNLVGSVDLFRRTRRDYWRRRGAVLAHVMGLGKTLQAIAFIEIIYRYIGSDVGTLLIVPVSVLDHWRREIKRWLPIGRPAGFRDSNIFVISSDDTPDVRALQINRWEQSRGVLMIGYELYRMLVCPSAAKVASIRPSVTTLGKVLLDSPDFVILDEGHRIKNYYSGIAKVLNCVRTRRRLILTGTPLQNNLTEYFTMVNFVAPYKLGSKAEFDEDYRHPIEAGCLQDSEEYEVREMHRMSYRLQTVLRDTVQRRGYEVIKAHLPEKTETVIVVKQSAVQYRLNKMAFESVSAQIGGAQFVDSFNPLLMYAIFRKILTHPSHFLARIEQCRYDRDADELFEDVGGADLRKARLVDVALDGRWDEPLEKWPPATTRSVEMSPKLKVMRGLIEGILKTSEKCLIFAESVQSIAYIEDYMVNVWREFRCPRATAASSSVKSERKPAVDKVRTGALPKTEPSTSATPTCKQARKQIDGIFGDGDDFLQSLSQGVDGMALADDFYDDEAAYETRSWQEGVTYLRMDGSTTQSDRCKKITQFNGSNVSALSPEDVEDVRVFIISTKAGGIGINLATASRAILFDTCWNPSNDEQAVARIFRFGQTRPCHIYRLVVFGSMEERVFKRQMKKMGVARRCVDSENVHRKLTRKETDELYAFEELEEATTPIEPAELLPTIAATNDAVLKALFTGECADYIARVPFEIDSLLSVNPVSGLSDEQKRQVMREYHAKPKRDEHGLTDAERALVASNRVDAEFCRPSSAGVMAPIEDMVAAANPGGGTQSGTSGAAVAQIKAASEDKKKTVELLKGKGVVAWIYRSAATGLEIINAVVGTNLMRYDASSRQLKVERKMTCKEAASFTARYGTVAHKSATDVKVPGSKIDVAPKAAGSPLRHGNSSVIGVVKGSPSRRQVNKPPVLKRSVHRAASSASAALPIAGPSHRVLGSTVSSAVPASSSATNENMEHE